MAWGDVVTEDRISADALRDEPPSADEDVAKLRLQSNKSLEELVEDGEVEWDREANVVVKGPYFERGRPLKD
jgi:hypothetical protein